MLVKVEVARHLLVVFWRLGALMIMRLLLGAAALSISVCGPAWAEDDDTLLAENCASLPYSVAIEVAGGEVAANLTSETLKSLLGSAAPEASGEVGLEYIADAVKGANDGAFSSVLDYYGCRSRNAIRAEIRRGRMTSADLDAFDARHNVAAQFYEELAVISLDAVDSAEAVAEIANSREAARERIRQGFEKTPVSSAVRGRVTRALNGISANDFTRLNRVVSWGRVRAEFGEIGACVGVITNVLEGAHGNLQVSLSSTPAFYRSFFRSSPTQSDGQAGPAIIGYGRIVRSLNFPEAEAVDNTFMSCARNLLQEVDPEAAREIAQPEADTPAAVPPSTSAETDAPVSATPPSESRANGGSISQ